MLFAVVLEWAHLTRGIAYLQTGDARMSFAHPPLAKTLFAVPALLSGDVDASPVYEFEAWETSMDPGAASLELLRRDYEGARAALGKARVVSGLLFLAAVVYLYRFVRLWGSAWQALLAAIVLGWNPSIIGHARIATTDLPAAIFIAVAVCESLRAISPTARGIGWGRAGLAVGVALSVKYSAIFLILFVPLLLLAAALTQPKSLGGGTVRSRLVAGGLALVKVAVVALFVLNLSYSFQGTLCTVRELLAAPEPQYWISAGYGGELLETRTRLGGFPQWLRLPVPRTYLFGFVCVREQFHVGYPGGVFLESPNPDGDPRYFPVVMLLETPVWVLGLWCGGLVSLARAWRESTFDEKAMAVLVCALLAVLIFSRLNMGIRHALPQVFLMSVLSVLLTRGHFPRGARTGPHVVLAFAVLCGGASLASATGNYIGWFNAFVSDERGLQSLRLGKIGGRTWWNSRTWSRKGG